jgi:hypothetical protein
MLRIPVRIAGLLLLAIGSLLWLRARLVAPVAHPVAVAVVPAAKPLTKRHRHTEPVQPTAASLKPSHAPLSRDFMSENQGRHFAFEVDLHKSDGWFDTGIPVTADVDILMLCGLKLQALGPSCNQWVQAMLNGKIFVTGPPPPGPRSNIFTILPNETPPPPWGQNLDPALIMQMPDESTQTLKLRIVGDSAPEELDGYLVRISVRRWPGIDGGKFTPPQQLEMANMAKWVPK